MNSPPLQIMDVTSLRAVVTDLREIVLPSRFEKAQQPETGTIQIGLRSLQGLKWLELSWHAEAPRLVQISSPSRLGSESTLAQQIQHGLNKMALVEIKQSGFERVVKFGLAPRPGSPIKRVLVIELMGRHSNILLLDEQNKVITLGRQIGTHQSRVRPIGTGDIYVDPPSLQNSAPHSKESFEKWKRKLSLIPYKLKKALQENYQGISPSLALQLAHNQAEIAQKLLDLPVTEIPDEQWKFLYKRWCSWLLQVESESLNLSFKGPTSFMVWSEELNESKNQENISLTLGKYYRNYLNKKKLDELIKELNRKITKLRENEQSSLFKQQNLLQRTHSNKALQEEADELLCLPSPNRDSINKSQKLYQKAKKLRRSLPVIKERISYHKQRLERIQESSTFFEDLCNNQWEGTKEKITNLMDLRDELDELQTTSSQRSLNHQRKNKALIKNKVPNPLVLKSPGGLEVQIGRNHRQNEWISLHKSRTGDIWFHVQECPGSHVVLKASNGIAEDVDIQMALDLAAFFSRARGNQRVPVLMVATDNLQRIPGATLGAVRHRKGTVCWGEPSRGMQHIKS